MKHPKVKCKSPSLPSNSHCHFYLSINTITSIHSFIINIIQIDNDLSSETSSLTTALSGQTPTDPFGDDPTIQALLQAASNADYELVVATIPLHHKLTIKRIQYILFEPYSTRRSKKVAWY